MLLEASGGVTLETVRAIAETGVDRMSVGAVDALGPGPRHRSRLPAMTPPRQEWSLDTRRLAVVCWSTTSRQHEQPGRGAWRTIRPTTGIAILADEQTAGAANMAERGWPRRTERLVIAAPFAAARTCVVPPC